MNARRAGWELPVLLVAAAVVALPDLFDLEAFKLGAVALLAAVVLLPWLIWAGRDDVAGWYSTLGARLLLFTAAWSLLGSLTVLHHAAVADRVLGLLLAQLAAVLGLRAARAAPGALLGALQIVVMVTAVVGLVQAAGIDRLFTSSSLQVVALMGNTTRAGALLALGVVAAFVTVTDGTLDARDWRLRLGLSALLLGSAALVLTRARGGWIAAAGGLLAVAFMARDTALQRLKLWAPRVILGVGLAVVLADDHWHVLTASKLPDQAATVAGAGAVGAAVPGGDVTVQVRLAIWRACLPMIARQPLEGWGLGRFRESFPPFRDPAEAALPGLGGARTEVDHPHNEFVLAFAEGGAPAGLCLLAFAALTLWRGGRRARHGGSGDVLAFGVVVAGTLVALVQNAWTSPGTALPIFAAAGWIWRPDVEPLFRPAARAATGALLLAAMAALVILAVPRVESECLLRRFYLRADADGGYSRENIPLLVRAADADPGDPDVQRVLLTYGTQLEAALAGGKAPESAELAQALQRARARLAELAPSAAGPEAPH